MISLKAQMSLCVRYLDLQTLKISKDIIIIIIIIMTFLCN